MLARVEADPFVPTYWGKNQKGMQADEELSEKDRRIAESLWRVALDSTLEDAKRLMSLGVHKQLVNRLMEPFMWHTVIVTATEYENFFALRNHKDAQPEIKEVASLMSDLYRRMEPVRVEEGFWHLPLVADIEELRADGYSEEEIRLISVGRCARVSYLTHDGKRDPKADIALCQRLQASGHMSPFEHVAQAQANPIQSGNFTGWRQFRKDQTNEAIYQPTTA